MALSNLSLLSLLAAFVLLVVAAYRRVRWSLVLAGVALAAEIGAALLLLVHEPQPAYLHPEWAWYWPVVDDRDVRRAVRDVHLDGGERGLEAQRAQPSVFATAPTAWMLRSGGRAGDRTPDRDPRTGH